MGRAPNPFQRVRPEGGGQGWRPRESDLVCGNSHAEQGPRARPVEADADCCPDPRGQGAASRSARKLCPALQADSRLARVPRHPRAGSLRLLFLCATDDGPRWHSFLSHTASSPLFHNFPAQDAFRGLRSIPLGAKASAFAGLDDDTIVVGLEVLAPLEVWDLASGELVRQFEGMGQKCRSIIKISDERIAVGWHTWGGKDAVSIFDGRTGKLLQNLILNVFGAVAMTFVEEHLITMCSGSRIHVWNQDSAGKVRWQRALNSADPQFCRS